jgi:hypothetical protein
MRLLNACLALGSAGLPLGCAPAESRIIYVASCRREEALPATSAEDAAAPAPVFKSAAARPRSDSPCREVTYDPLAGPLLYSITETEDGVAVFESDLPFAPGQRFASVIDEDNDAPPNELPLDVTVDEVTKEEGSYRISTRFPLGLFAPSRVVGPLDAGASHLVGRQGEGQNASDSAIGKPQLQYQVWLEQGILEDVLVRCSSTVFVSQTWLVTDKRTCVRSSFERLEGGVRSR